MKEAGIKTVFVFIDGWISEIHDHQRGTRARVYLVVKARGNFFDNGEFTIIEELLNAPLPKNDSLYSTNDCIQWPEN